MCVSVPQVLDYVRTELLSNIAVGDREEVVNRLPTFQRIRGSMEKARGWF